MRLARLGHSCILVETGSGARLLVDPGIFSEVPDEIVSGSLDAVLLTHLHPDHLDVAVLKAIRAAHEGIPIYGPADAIAALAAEGIAAADHAFADLEVAGARIEVLEAGHEPILGVAPMNAAYRVDGKLAITGDSASHVLEAWAETRVLALPVAAPWTTAPAQAAFLGRMRPAAVFPVHDGILVSAFRKAVASQFAMVAEEQGIRFVDPGVVLEDL